MTLDAMNAPETVKVRRGRIHTNGLETFCALLKRGLAGM